MTTATGLAAAHPAVAGYASRHRIDAGAFRSDGRLTLRFDARYRVHVVAASSGRIALTSRLADLSERTPAEADALLARLAGVATGMMRDQAAGLCIDEVQRTLILQHILPADTDEHRLEGELAEFVNALAFWTRLCAAAPGGRPA